jgi:hypothetical protein
MARIAPANGKPHWDSKRRRLTFRGRVVKEFGCPAPCQELILAAFEEEGWPSCVDDPLPGVAGLDAKKRLRRIIEDLNGCQRHRLIRFRGNGLGTGIRWEPAREG